MSELTNLLLLAFIGSVAGLIGGLLLILNKRLASFLCDYATPLAAGVFLGLALLDLLPESVELIGSMTFTVVLIVFVVLFLVERFLFSLHHHHDIEDHHQHGTTSIPLVIFGDTIHNFLDGAAIAASFVVNPSLGLLVAVSAFLHETPHEIADFSILLSKGWSKSKTLGVNFLSALATFPGALITYYYSGSFENGAGILLAIAAALFLYVALTDFLPEVEHSHRRSIGKQALVLILGIVAIMALGAFVS